MTKNNNFFSKEINEKHITYSFFGIKYSVKNKEFKEKAKNDCLESKIIQDNYDLTNLKNAKELVVFLTPGEMKMSGGVMSIFSLCETSRKLLPNSTCIISTFPNGITYAKNNEFPNDEIVYRFSQIEKNCKKLKKLIIHIPEFFAHEFCKSLSKKDTKFLKSIKDLQINIMNQNIELMLEPAKIKDLYKFSSNITQTIAHDRYATQEVCDKWQIPTHLFSALWDMSKYRKREFNEKEKIIVLSPDYHKDKDKIVNKLKEKFNDWQFITVEKMKFAEYMNLISKALFIITFGEGFDGYFTQPSIVGSIGIAVYNNEFFPDNSWLNLSNVFENYEDMSENIVNFINDYSSNFQKYTELSVLNKKKHDEIYNFKQYEDNLRRFYEKKYDFLPQREGC